MAVVQEAFEQANQPIHTQPKTGIGREVSEGWLANFYTILEEELPSSAYLMVVRTPGLVYATGKDLEALNRRQYSQEHIRAFIGGLCTDGVLDADTANQPHTASINYLKVNQERNGLHSLRLRINDKRTQAYSDSYLFQGERVIIKDSLGLSQESTTQAFGRHGPRPRICLGRIDGCTETEIYEALLNTKTLMSRSVDLSPIDAV